MSRLARVTVKNLFMLVMVGATIYMIIDIMSEDSQEENSLLKRQEWRKEDFHHPGEISEKDRQGFYDKVRKTEQKYVDVKPPQNDLLNQLFKGIPGGPGAVFHSDSALELYNKNLKNYQASNGLLMKLAQRRKEIREKNELEKQKNINALLGVQDGFNGLLGQLQGGAGAQQMGYQAPSMGQLQNPPQNGYNYQNMGLNYPNFNPGNNPNGHLAPGLNNFDPAYQNSFVDPNQELHPDKQQVHPDKFGGPQQLLNGMSSENGVNQNFQQNNLDPQQSRGTGGQSPLNQYQLLQQMMEAKNREMEKIPPQNIPYENNPLGNIPDQNNPVQNQPSSNYAIGNFPDKNNPGDFPAYPGNHIQNPSYEYQNNQVNENGQDTYPDDHPSYMGSVPPNNDNSPNLENSPPDDFQNITPLLPNFDGDHQSTQYAPQEFPSGTASPPAGGETSSIEDNQVYSPPDSIEGEPRVEIEGNHPKDKEIPLFDNNEPEKLFSDGGTAPPASHYSNIMPANQDYDETEEQQQH